MYADKKLVLYKSRKSKNPLLIFRHLWQHNERLALLFLSLTESDCILKDNSSSVNLSFIKRAVHKGNHLILGWNDFGYYRTLHISQEFCTLDLLSIRACYKLDKTFVYRKFKIFNPTLSEISFFSCFLNGPVLEILYKQRFGIALEDR